MLWGLRSSFQIRLSKMCMRRFCKDQNEAFATGASKKRWPDSEHNNEENPGQDSNAADVAPWIDSGIPWHDKGSFDILAGVIYAAANELGVKVRIGGDWDGETDPYGGDGQRDEDGAGHS